jgi:Galactose-binding domain-like
MKSSVAVKIVFSLFFALSVSSITQADTQVNPNHIYIYKGEPTGYRSISLGDPKNWSVSIKDRQGQSESNAISIKPTDFKATGDAIQLTWNKKSVQGNFAIYGEAIDLSKYKDSVYLTIDMRIDEKPKGDVSIGMDCGYPCRADLKINKMIKSMKKGEWFSLPLPLNCLKGDTFDLSKINGPFTISSSNPFVLSITNVRLEKMPDDDKGCVDKK